MNSEISRRLKSVPTIARIIIRQATIQRAEGAITEATFLEQIRRITREELTPRALTLLVRDLPDGRMRFLFKEDATGRVCEMMDFASDGTLEADDSDTPAQASEELASASNLQLQH
jgi:hypothetical protein